MENRIEALEKAIKELKDEQKRTQQLLIRLLKALRVMPMTEKEEKALLRQQQKSLEQSARVLQEENDAATPEEKPVSLATDSISDISDADVFEGVVGMDIFGG